MIKQKYIVIPLLLACIISCLAISAGDTPLAPPFVIELKRYLNYGICAWLLLVTNWKKHVDNLALKLLSVLFWFVLKNFHVHVSGSVDLIVTLSLITILFAEESVLLTVLRYFKTFLVVITILGFISYIDSLTGMHLPHTIVPFFDVDDSLGYDNNAFYLNHFFSYTLVQSDGPRLCTLFNEPGYYGTMVALMLIISKLELKKPENLILLIGGFLSLSMAYFILIALGFLLYSIGNVKYRISLVIVVAILFIAVPRIHFQSDILNNLISRFEFNTETMSFSGDDREGEGIKYLYNQFQQSDKKILGYGTGYCNTSMGGSSTYKKPLIEWGYLGFFLTYGLLFISAFLDCKRNKMALAYIFCFMISIYQRPSIFTMAYFLILFAGVKFIMKDERVVNKFVSE